MLNAEVVSSEWLKAPPPAKHRASAQERTRAVAAWYGHHPLPLHKGRVYELPTGEVCPIPEAPRIFSYRHSCGHRQDRLLPRPKLFRCARCAGLDSQWEDVAADEDESALAEEAAAASVAAAAAPVLSQSATAAAVQPAASIASKAPVAAPSASTSARDANVNRRPSSESLPPVSSPASLGAFAGLYASLTASSVAAAARGTNSGGSLDVSALAGIFVDEVVSQWGGCRAVVFAVVSDAEAAGDAAGGPKTGQRVCVLASAGEGAVGGAGGGELSAPEASALSQCASVAAEVGPCAVVEGGDVDADLFERLSGGAAAAAGRRVLLCRGGRRCVVVVDWDGAAEAATATASGGLGSEADVGGLVCCAAALGVCVDGGESDAGSDSDAVESLVQMLNEYASVLRAGVGGDEAETPLGEGDVRRLMSDAVDGAVRALTQLLRTVEVEVVGTPLLAVPTLPKDALSTGTSTAGGATASSMPPPPEWAALRTVHSADGSVYVPVRGFATDSVAFALRLRPSSPSPGAVSPSSPPSSPPSATAGVSTHQVSVAETVAAALYSCHAAATCRVALLEVSVTAETPPPEGSFTQSVMPLYAVATDAALRLAPAGSSVYIALVSPTPTRPPPLSATDEHDDQSPAPAPVAHGVRKVTVVAQSGYGAVLHRADPPLPHAAPQCLIGLALPSAADPSGSVGLIGSFVDTRSRAVEMDAVVADSGGDLGVVGGGGRVRLSGAVVAGDGEEDSPFPLTDYVVFQDVAAEEDAVTFAGGPVPHQGLWLFALRDAERGVVGVMGVEAPVGPADPSVLAALQMLARTVSVYRSGPLARAMLSLMSRQAVDLLTLTQAVRSHPVLANDDAAAAGGEKGSSGDGEMRANSFVSHTASAAAGPAPPQPFCLLRGLDGNLVPTARNPPSGSGIVEALEELRGMVDMEAEELAASGGAVDGDDAGDAAVLPPVLMLPPPHDTIAVAAIVMRTEEGPKVMNGAVGAAADDPATLMAVTSALARGLSSAQHGALDTVPPGEPVLHVETVAPAWLVRPLKVLLLDSYATLDLLTDDVGGHLALSPEEPPADPVFRVLQSAALLAGASSESVQEWAPLYERVCAEGFVQRLVELDVTHPELNVRRVALARRWCGGALPAITALVQAEVDAAEEEGVAAADEPLRLAHAVGLWVAVTVALRRASDAILRAAPFDLSPAEVLKSSGLEESAATLTQAAAGVGGALEVGSALTPLFSAMARGYTPATAANDSSRPATTGVELLAEEAARGLKSLLPEGPALTFAIHDWRTGSAVVGDDGHVQEEADEIYFDANFGADFVAGPQSLGEATRMPMVATA